MTLYISYAVHPIQRGSNEVTRMRAECMSVGRPCPFNAFPTLSCILFQLKQGKTLIKQLI